MALIWQEVLGTRGLGIHDNFFEAGGNSLLAIRLVLKINGAFEAGISALNLFQNPTIDRILRLVGEKGCHGLRKPAVVLMKDGGGKTPVFFIYGTPDELLIAELFSGDRRVYGIQVPWRREWHASAAKRRRASLPTLEQLVAPYVDELRSRPEARRCILAGFSFGGLMAFEAARKLKKHGVEVETVMLFDSYAKHPSLTDHLTRLSGMVSNEVLGAAGRGRRCDSTRAALRNLWDIFRPYLCDLIRPLPLRIRGPMQSDNITSHIDEDGEGLAWGHVKYLYDTLHETYRPLPIDCRSALFRAEDSAGRVLDGGDENLGWTGLFERGITIHPATGGHHSMFLHEPHRSKLAAEIQRALDHLDRVTR